MSCGPLGDEAMMTLMSGSGRGVRTGEVAIWFGRGLGCLEANGAVVLLVVVAVLGVRVARAVRLTMPESNTSYTWPSVACDDRC